MQNATMRLQLFLFSAFLTLAMNPAFAADSAAIVDTALQHARLQTRDLPGKVSIEIGQFDGSRLPNCDVLEAYTPPGGKMIGRTQIGVRCLAPASWRVLLAANISVSGNYLTTTRTLLAGEIIQASDLAILTGDLATLPAGVLTDPAKAIGMTVRNSLAAGNVLRSNQLLAPIVIRQGQTVRVISTGEGFSVSAEGKAIGNASVGQVTQVRMSSGQTVSGIAKPDGSVEVSF